MPTYEYRCNACKHEFEQVQSMKDNALRKCPKCGKNALERLIGAGAAVIFRGSGFYQTDYRSDSYKAGEKAASGDSKPADGGKTDAASKDAPAKSETPAPKPEPKAEKPKAETKPKKSKDKGKD
jgi:putative FmdB family regulatory protein